RYKRKPFVSYYWDCRLRGRPSGTPESDDTTKRKRRRVSRERDLCDVRIKVIEHFQERTAFPGAGDCNKAIEAARSQAQTSHASLPPAHSSSTSTSEARNLSGNHAFAGNTECHQHQQQ
ncbi:hypothetical protein KEM54_003163, partial [Ascosphaera aggregata]